MAKRILDMLRWHPEMNFEDCKVTYLHRGRPGNLKTIKATNIQTLERRIYDYVRWINGSLSSYSKNRM